MPKKEFRVGPNAGEGVRLDVYLSRVVPEITRSQFQHFVDKDRVTVDGMFRKSSYKLRAGERIEIDVEIPPPEPIRPEAIPLTVLFSDAHVIVVDKPSGMVVHPGTGNRRGTLVNALMYHFPEVVGLGEEERSGIVHRLDADTSGVMVVARSPRAYDELKRQFKSREVKKIYLALVNGPMDKPEGTLDWPIGRHVTDGHMISIKTRKPRVAITDYRVKRHYGGFDLLEVHPHTGRTHQIRVHLATAGHPVAGDRRYGERKSKTKFPRLFLHAHVLGFRHPETGEWMEFRVPMPAELEQILQKLDAATRPAGA